MIPANDSRQKEEAREEQYSREQQRDDLLHNGTSAEQLRAQASNFNPANAERNERIAAQANLMLQNMNYRDAILQRLDALRDGLAATEPKDVVDASLSRLLVTTIGTCREIVKEVFAEFRK